MPTAHVRTRRASERSYETAASRASTPRATRCDAFRAARPDDARAPFEQVALGDPLEEFLTTPAYEVLLG